MKKINDYLVELERTYVASLTVDGTSKVKGHRAFNETGNFVGLYDKENNTLWSIDKTTLLRLK